jgi:hypothetical protein
MEKREDDIFIAAYNLFSMCGIEKRQLLIDQERLCQLIQTRQLNFKSNT